MVDLKPQGTVTSGATPQFFVCLYLAVTSGCLCQVCSRLHQAKKRVLDPELDHITNPHEVGVQDQFNIIELLNMGLRRGDICYLFLPGKTKLGINKFCNQSGSIYKVDHLKYNSSLVVAKYIKT